MLFSLFTLVRYGIAWIDLCILTTILYPLCWLPSRFTQAFLRRLYQYWCWAFIRALGVDLKLHQKNKYPLPKQYILIGNHPSVFEDIGVPALFPQVRFLAKEAVKSWWIVGKISQALGTFYVIREDKSDRSRSREDLAQALKQGYSIGLYPEGGCKGRRVFLPFRQGVFDLSIETNVPIVPLFLHYEAQSDFEWQDEHILRKLWIILCSKNKTANYYVYDAIYPSQFDSKESFCTHMQNCYLAWQKAYLE